MHTSSPGFECLLLAVTVIFFTSDFWGMPAVLQTDKSLSETGGEGENAVASFRFYLERKAPHCLFVCLFHLHIKQGGGGGKQ